VAGRLPGISGTLTHAQNGAEGNREDEGERGRSIPRGTELSEEKQRKKKKVLSGRKLLLEI